MSQCKAFTLIEIMIVIVVISIMAGFAVPNMSKMKHKAIFSEGVQALRTLHAAQLRYNVKGVNNEYAYPCDELDVDITLPEDKWKDLVCSRSGSVNVTWTAGDVFVSWLGLPVSPEFTMVVDRDGNFYCTSSCRNIECPSFYSYLWSLCPGECRPPASASGSSTQIKPCM